MTILYSIRGRKVYYLILDSLIIIFSFLISYLFRFYPDLRQGLNLMTPWSLAVIPAFIISYYFFKIYKIMWTYSTFEDVYRLMLANITGFLVYSSSIFLFTLDYSRMISILSFMIISVITIFYRIILRDYYSKRRATDGEDFDLFKKNKSSEDGKRIIIIGAGEAGRHILSEYRKTGTDRSVSGFVDDDKDKIGRMFSGKNVFAGTSRIKNVIEEHNINEIIIAMPSVKADKINDIVNIIRKDNQKIPIKTLPPLIELIDNKHLTLSLRNISLADLIGREEVRIDSRIIEENFSGKTVLITGAGGSIGSEICKQLIKYKIKKLIAVGRGEFSIYNLVKSINEFAEFMDEMPEIVYRIADVKDYQLFYTIFEEYEPDVVFHAAAHKHVPIMEYNEIEAIQNNVSGTKNILDLSNTFKVKKFVLVSTDKAVRPTNIMGATKRLAELITGYYNRSMGLNTAIVRFGNVIGSRGSVIPLFKEQIEKGGPVTVTHKDITRYFMSIPEASILVINSAAYSKGGELFVLDMGTQYKIVDIVKRLIGLYGFKPDEDIKIKYTGLRPGEKMFEELFYENNSLIKTDNEKIFILNKDSVALDEKTVEDFINNDLPNVIRYDSLQLREMLQRMIPDYTFDMLCNDIDSCSRFVN